MWMYSESTGKLTRNQVLVGMGYSGAGEDKNNPADEDVKGQGPIPRGVYDIGQPVDSQYHGPFVLPLQPVEGNEMFGRGGFLIHGDSITQPGCASKGCVILNRKVREQIAVSGDRKLTVTE